jgi:hypothetical protein
VPFEVAERLWLIANFNAHEFRGRIDAASSSEVVLAPSAKHAALFVVGSKGEHSCLPNVTCGDETGRLVYTSVRPIAAGDRISYAYVPTCQEDTQARREVLLTTSGRGRGASFLCACARCEGPDVCRPLPCSACTNGVALRTSPAESIHSSATGDSPELLMVQLKLGVGATWTCLSCNALATDAEMGAAMREEARLVEDLEQRSRVPEVSPGMVRVAQQQQFLLHSALPPSHHLHLTCSELFSSFAASMANVSKGMQPHELATAVQDRIVQPTEQLQWEAAVSAVETIVWRERSQAVLLGRTQPQATWQPASQLGLSPSPQARLAHIMGSVWSGSNEAAALQPYCDSAKDALYAGMDLVDAGAAAHAAPIFRRYRDAIFSRLSNDDVKRCIHEVLGRFPATQ